MKNRILIGVGCCLLNLLTALAADERIDLSGIWRFQLDPLGFGKTPGSELYLDKLVETIVLPGSTDQGVRASRTMPATWIV